MAFPSDKNWSSVAWNGTVWCAIGQNTAVAATSPDGFTWTERTLPSTSDWRKVVWNGTVFCAIAWGGTVAATSPDGITWTARTLPASANWSSLAWNGTVFAAVAWGGTAAATSPDGITWTSRTLPASVNWIDVAWNGSVFCAIANGSSTCATSPDGTTWTSRSIGATASWRAIASDGSSFMVIADATAAARWSADGTTWYSRTASASSGCWRLAWGGTQYIAIINATPTSASAISANGMTWTAVTLPDPSGGAWSGIAWSGTEFCAITDYLVTATSADGATWATEAPPPPTGTATAPTALTVVNPSGTATAPTKLTVTATGSVSAPTLLALIDATDATTWTARCLIDGVDVSARLTGQASVTADEGAARIADITLLPASGVIDPLDYVGKPITLDYVLVIGGVEVPRRLFTGRIDTPDYDPASTLLRLSCVDDLQNRVAALDRTVIDGLIGGRYTEAVQGEVDDNWDYAEALLTTVAASLDAGPSGGMRLTPWELATTWATFDEGDLLYERARLTLPQRSTMVNTVNIEFDYRYPRLRQRYTTLGWSGTQIDMAPCGYAYPTQQDLIGAASGSGWTVTLGVFFPAPAAIPHGSGGFIYTDDGAIDMAVLTLTQRHSQTVTESYALTVSAPESVTQNGELPHALRGALASEFDGVAWESALDLAPLMASGGDQDYAPDAPRADADYAIDTLLDQARVKILGSHRNARVGNAILCNPDLDLDKKVAIATAMVSAAGKVASVTHVLDFAAGSAISEFELAIFGAGGAGIITPDTLAPPDPPAEAAETQDWPGDIPPLYVNTYGVTAYSENLMGLLLNPPESIFVEDIPGVGSQSIPNPYYVAGSYPVTGFRVRMPGVDDVDRNPIDKPVSASYSIIVPADTMTFTVP